MPDEVPPSFHVPDTKDLLQQSEKLCARSAAAHAQANEVSKRLHLILQDADGLCANAATLTSKILPSQERETAADSASGNEASQLAES